MPQIGPDTIEPTPPRALATPAQNAARSAVIFSISCR
jgi:hypothetical protein